MTKLLNGPQKAATAKHAEIQDLREKLDASGVAQRLAPSQAVGEVEKDRDDLLKSIERVEFENQVAKKSTKDKYEIQIKTPTIRLNGSAT